MASNGLLISLLLILFLHNSSQADEVSPPPRHGMTIIKDSVTSQYFTTFIVGQPPITFTLLIDLGNLYSWVRCDRYDYYKSTTYKPIPCGSAECLAYGQGRAPCLGCSDPKPSPSCNNNTCGAYAYTPWSKGLYLSDLIEDVIFLYTRPENSYKVLQYRVLDFPFACSRNVPLEGISVSAKGILTLANVNIALHSVISRAFKVPHKFSLCLPSTNTILYRGFEGALYIGGGPYFMSKENRVDFSKYLIRTPLITHTNPKRTTTHFSEFNKFAEYFINVKSIEVEEVPLKFDNSLLSVNQEGFGGTKLSTLHPYTVLHSNIYKGLVDAFTTNAKAMNISRVASVAPFGACYNSSYVTNITSGPRVPVIDFILDGKDAKWRIYGANSMVKFFDFKYRDVLCLGFVDGGLGTPTSIVIGGKQMEDNFVEIDLESSRIGVTSMPVNLGLSCSQFRSTLPTF